MTATSHKYIVKLPMDYKELLIKILLKKAKGYTYKEKTDEYVVVDGVRTLQKSKVTTKKTHPDVSAIRALIELSNSGVEICAMTDEQLQQEKERLLGLLAIAESSPPTND